MVKKPSTKPTWIVVEVNSGIPVGVQAFSNQDTAINYLESLRENLNPDNDEAGIFEINLSSDIRT